MTENSLRSRPLDQGYKEVAKSLFNKRPGTEKGVNRKSHSEYQEKINGLFSNIKLFEKGIKLFDGMSAIPFIAMFLILNASGS